MFDPACVYCGARYLRGLAELPITAGELTRRRRGVLDVWSKAGHDPERLKRIAAEAGVPIEPERRRGRGKA